MKIAEIEDVRQLTEEYMEEHGLYQAILYFLDHVGVYKEDPIPPYAVDEAQLVEGYWFGNDAFLHVFRREVGEKPRMISAEDQEGIDECISRTYKLRSGRFGKLLTVRHYLKSDEDGQYAISFSRPVHIE